LLIAEWQRLVFAVLECHLFGAAFLRYIVSFTFEGDSSAGTQPNDHALAAMELLNQGGVPALSN
jgi:hypothetical protein